MQLRYSYRLYPTAGQRSALARAFGCARVVFNDALAARQQAHAAGLPFLTDAALSAGLTAAKAAPERAWLGEVSAVILQQSLADLTTAYRRFFAYRTALAEWQRGGRKGPKPKEVGLPRFKSRKDTRQGIRFTSNARFQVLPGGTLRLPKIGDVPVRWSRPLPSPPSSVTVIQDSAGRYGWEAVVVRLSEELVRGRREQHVLLALARHPDGEHVRPRHARLTRRHALVPRPGELFRSALARGVPHPEPEGVLRLERLRERQGDTAHVILIGHGHMMPHARQEPHPEPRHRSPGGNCSPPKALR